MEHVLVKCSYFFQCRKDVLRETWPLAKVRTQAMNRTMISRSIEIHVIVLTAFYPKFKHPSDIINKTGEKSM